MSSVENSKPIVFVVGSARSGTSTILSIIRQCFKVDSDTEGHITPMLTMINRVVNDYYNNNSDANSSELNTISRIGVDWILSIVIQRYKNFLMESESGWCDKTPGADAIEALPLLAALWPDIKIIYVQRNGWENVRSRCKKFPQIAFEKHCEHWAYDVTTWRNCRMKLASHSYIEIDTSEFADYDSLLSKIENFVGIKADRIGMLEVERERSVWGGGHSYWSDQKKTVFDRICGSMMRASHYVYPPDIHATRFLDLSNICVADPGMCYITTDVRGSWIFIHPTQSHEFPSIVVINRVHLNTSKKFVTRLRHTGFDSNPVLFTVSFTDASGAFYHYCNTIDVGCEMDWRQDIDINEGMYNVEVRTIVANYQSNARCWTSILSLSFEL